MSASCGDPDRGGVGETASQETMGTAGGGDYMSQREPASMGVQIACRCDLHLGTITVMGASK